MRSKDTREQSARTSLILLQHSYCSLCVLQAAQQSNAPEEGKKDDNDKGEEQQGEEDGNRGERSKRSVVDYMQEVTEPARLQEKDMQSYNQKQPGRDEKETDRWNDRPVAQRPGNGDVRLQDTQPTQEQYEHRDIDNQQRETIDKDEDEDHDEQDSDLSRKNINKKMAEMQENYNKKRIKEQQQQQQQEMQILPQGQNSDARGRSVYRHVPPIPAVQRQDTAEEQSDGRLFCQKVISLLCVSLIVG